MTTPSLRNMLGRLVEGQSATPNDINLIAQSLLSTREERGLGFLALKRIIDGAAGPSATPGIVDDQAGRDTELIELLGTAAGPLRGLAGKDDVEPDGALPVLAVLGAVFPLAPQVAVGVLRQPIALPCTPHGIHPGVAADTALPTDQDGDNSERGQAGADLMALILELAELPGRVQLALAEMLAAATGSRVGRAFVRARAMEWLEGAVDYTSPHLGEGTVQGAEESDAQEGQVSELGGVCAVALTKLGMAQDSDETLPGEGAGLAANGGGQSGASSLGGNEAYLADKMASTIIASAASSSSSRTSSSSSSTLISTLEGLSVLSTKPVIKQKLAQDARFLAALLALSPVPERKGGSLPLSASGKFSSRLNGTPSDAPIAPVDTGVCYGITTILLHLSLRRPVLSAEDEQMAKLRAMAAAASLSDASARGNKTGKLGDKLANDVDEMLDADEAVCARVGLLYAAGVVSALSGLSRAAKSSDQVRAALGQLCLMLVTEQRHRAVFVRDGGFKVLGGVIRDALAQGHTASNGSMGVAPPPTLPPSTATKASELGVNEQILPALQALAKLAITTPPPLLFPPPFQTTALNALVPLYTLLSHPASSVLQIFEALMALTNLASIDPSIADRIVLASVATVPQASDDNAFRGSGREDEGHVRILAKVEELLMDDNGMVRRAATELACNLAGSPAGFAYLSGEDGGPAPGDSSGSWKDKGQDAKRVASRLHLLFVLLDSDDLPTRLAAGGALAIVSDSSTACSHMLGVDSKTSSKRTAWQRLADLFRPRELEAEGEEQTEERIRTIDIEQPDQGMMMRGAVILANLLGNVVDGPDPAVWAREKGKVEQAGVKEVLMDVLQGGGESGRDLLEPVVEALKVLQRAK